MRPEEEKQAARKINRPEVTSHGEKQLRPRQQKEIKIMNKSKQTSGQEAPVPPTKAAIAKQLAYYKAQFYSLKAEIPKLNKMIGKKVGKKGTKGRGNRR
jgi:hypothetical protein